MSEIILRVGKKGEIYTTRKVREKLGIRENSFVGAYIVEDKLIIKPILSVEEKIKRHIVEISPEEAEKLSEEAQREEGVYG